MLYSDTTGRQSLRLDPDVQLMLQVQGGDEGAFEELIERFQDRVLSLVFNQLGNREEAEDLTQEVFLRVYRARLRYQPTAKFTTWLFHITNNLCSNAKRKRRARPTISLQTRDSGPLGPRPQEQLVAESGRNGLKSMERVETAAVVQAAVARLGDRQRMAVLLNKFEDMNYAEIGEVMGMSEAAVKSLMARARDRLREILKLYLRQDR